MGEKNLPASTEQRRELVDAQHPSLSIRRQCELLGLTRSSYYYEPAMESEENLALMRRIDELYLQRPFFGSRRMAEHLSSPEGPVNRKRVQRLMQKMGIEAVYPGKKTSVAGQGHKIYPYLLCALKVILKYDPKNREALYAQEDLFHEFGVHSSRRSATVR